jgi:hypothetical protein
MMAVTYAGGGSRVDRSCNLVLLRPHQLLVACVEELQRQPSDGTARSDWLSLGADPPRLCCSRYC